MNEIVKLYLYQLNKEQEQTDVHIFTVPNWSDILFVEMSKENYYQNVDEIGDFLTILRDKYPDRAVIFVNPESNIQFYGVKPVEENNGSRSADSELQHEELTEETSR